MHDRKPFIRLEGKHVRTRPPSFFLYVGVKLDVIAGGYYLCRARDKNRVSFSFQGCKLFFECHEFFNFPAGAKELRVIARREFEFVYMQITRSI